MRCKVSTLRCRCYRADIWVDKDLRASSPTVSPVAVPSLEHRSPEELDLGDVKRGRGFSYHRPDGSQVKDPATLERIRGIVIPPAWTDVRISDTPDSHLQAVGRDARGRLQYRYHPHWTEFRDRVKFDRLPAFAAALPAIRRRIDADLGSPGVSREKVLATVVELLQTTLIRVGNEEYARDNGAYGLTTFRNKHATVNGSEIAFVFTGKSGLQHEVHAQDRRIARVLRAVPGDPRTAVVPVPRRRRSRRGGALARRERLPAGGRRRRRHRQGLPHVGGHGVRPAPSGASIPRTPSGSNRWWCGRSSRPWPGPREHADRRPHVVHPSEGHHELRYRQHCPRPWSDTPPRKARLTVDERRTRVLLATRQPPVLRAGPRARGSTRRRLRHAIQPDKVGTVPSDVSRCLHR